MYYLKLLFTLLIKDISGFINYKGFNSKNLINKVKCCIFDDIIISEDETTSLFEILNETTTKENYDGYNLAHNKYDNTTIKRITELYNKKKIFDKLIDSNIGTNDKLKIIEYSDLYPDKYVLNITAGGLYNDWNYNIPDETL
jgi:hypothetical protein